jgi:catechol 2,3-dioxygenase-like lactoylglutathione lyase family enzyme
MNITGSNVTIMVTDMQAAIDFYENIGLTLKQRWDNNYAMLTTEGITIGLHPSEGGELGSGSVSVGFMTDDISAVEHLLDKHGIAHDSVIDGGSGTYLYFKDPSGTVLYFVKPKWQ